MAESEPDRQLRLVKKAILLGVTGCFEWEERAQKKVRNDPVLKGVLPSEVKRCIVEHVRNGGKVVQKLDSDEEWSGKRNFDHYYSVAFIVPVPGLSVKYYVKIVLQDDEEELPEALIVGGHESG
jgi:hypothetical protein